MAGKYGIETDYQFSSKMDEGKEDGEHQQSNPQELLEILKDTANRLQKNAKCCDSTHTFGGRLARSWEYATFLFYNLLSR